MTPAETTTILRQYREWLCDTPKSVRPHTRQINEAIDAAIEMIERSAKLEQALQAMTKAYKSVPYTQWPAEMHFANEVLEKSK